jgi:hypothetical protein
MKPATIIGIVLILLGIVGFATGGFSFTHQHKDIDAGPIQVSHGKKETVPISPILSTIALVAGAGLVAVGAKK